MGTLGSLRRTAVATVAAVGALTLVIGCGSGDDSVTGGGKKNGKVTITMGLFGVMGIKETGLLEKYEKEHPDVDVKAEIAGDEQTYYTALQTRLAAGDGLEHDDDVIPLQHGKVTVEPLGGLVGIPEFEAELGSVKFDGRRDVRDDQQRRIVLHPGVAQGRPRTET